MRNAWSKYEKAGVRVIGVSSDSAESHRRFADKHNLPFSLVADEDGSWAEAFGVPSRLGFHARRSFLIGRDRKVAFVYSDVSPAAHASTVLADVQTLP